MALPDSYSKVSLKPRDYRDVTACQRQGQRGNLISESCSTADFITWEEWLPSGPISVIADCTGGRF
jgi:hypothetical protein